MSDIANTTMPISRQVAALTERIVVLMPKLLSCCSPAKANLLDPRLGQRDAHTAVPSIDMSLIEIPQCSGVPSDGGSG